MSITVKLKKDAPIVIRLRGKNYHRWTTLQALAAAGERDKYNTLKAARRVIERHVLHPNLRGRTDLYGNDYSPNTWLYVPMLPEVIDQFIINYQNR